MSASIPIESLNDWGQQLTELGQKIKDTAVPPTIKVSVRSVSQKNQPVVGYYTVFQKSGEPEKTGFTPCDFETPFSSIAATITVSDYGDAKFTKWSDGNTSRTRNMNLKSSVTLTAVYNIPDNQPQPSPPPPSGSAKAGIIVPLYTYANHASWKAVADTKIANPTVPVIAVVNPASGVGRVGVRSGGLFYSLAERKLVGNRRKVSEEQQGAILERIRSVKFYEELVKSRAIDANYSAGIKKLKAAGVQVLGYVSTNYGNRSDTDIKNEINTWYSWYPDIEGIFFDEQPNWGGFEQHYKSLNAHVKSKNAGHVTIGNPGSDSIPSYLSTVDIVLIYESPGLPSLSGYSSKWVQYDNWKLGMIPFGVPSLPEQWLRDASHFVGWLYVTNDVLSNPWDSIPPYYANMVSLIARL